MNTTAGDEEWMPANRPNVNCVNCGKTWLQHDCWSCTIDTNKPLQDKAYTKCKPDERYLTPDMPGFYLSPTTQMVKKIAKDWGIATDIAINKSLASKDDFVGFPNLSQESEWKVWARQPTGNCACGIVKSQCDYHK